MSRRAIAILLVAGGISAGLLALFAFRQPVVSSVSERSGFGQSVVVAAPQQSATQTFIAESNRLDGVGLVVAEPEKAGDLLRVSVRRVGSSDAHEGMTSLRGLSKWQNVVVAIPSLSTSVGALYEIEVTPESPISLATTPLDSYSKGSLRVDDAVQERDLIFWVYRRFTPGDLWLPTQSATFAPAVAIALLAGCILSVSIVLAWEIDTGSGEAALPAAVAPVSGSVHPQAEALRPRGGGD